MLKVLFISLMFVSLGTFADINWKNFRDNDKSTMVILEFRDSVFDVLELFDQEYTYGKKKGATLVDLAKGSRTILEKGYKLVNCTSSYVNKSLNSTKCFFLRTR